MSSRVWIIETSCGPESEKALVRPGRVALRARVTERDGRRVGADIEGGGLIPVPSIS